MGEKWGWAAVRGNAPSVILDRLKLKDTETASADVFSERWVMGAAPSGWTIVGSRNFEKVAGAECLSLLSQGGEAVGCWYCETTMNSQARGFRNGVEIWSVLHDPEKQLDEPVVSGDPPAVLKAITAEALAEKAADEDEEFRVDYIFDVPWKLAETICGLSSDDEPELGITFHVLKPDKSAAGGFLSRIFGRAKA